MFACSRWPALNDSTTNNMPPPGGGVGGHYSNRCSPGVSGSQLDMSLVTQGTATRAKGLSKRCLLEEATTSDKRM